jgi:hypothetical protein
MMVVMMMVVQGTYVLLKVKSSSSSEVSVKWWFLQNKIGLFASLNTALVPVKSNTLNYSVNGYTQKTTIISSFNSTINMRHQFISAGVCYKLGTHTRSKNN